jgi:hypothetical protein
MKIRIIVIGSLLAFLGSRSAQAGTTTLLTDDFSSAVINPGSSSVAAGVSSATQWYQNGADSTSVAAGMMSLAGNVGTSANNGRMVLAYFPSTGNLEVGSTVTLSYDFSLTGIDNGGGNALRVGLFYSASSRPALDSSGLIGLGSATAGSSDTANASYNAWQGYVLGFNHKSTGAANAANGSRFLQRVVNSASGLEQSLTSPTFYIGLSQPSSYGAGFSAAADTVYSATLSITRTSATELTLSYAVAGQAVNFSQTVTVGADDVIQFDAVNFYLKQGTTASTKMADSWNIGHVKIDLTTGSAAVAPAITTQPAGQSVAAGDSATFTVVATGTDPLSYQWKKDGTDLAGATAATLSLSNVSLADNGDYTVTITNSAGAVVSDAATLLVTETVLAPSITTSPASQAANLGGAATFTVAATGTQPFTYRWFKDNALIAGAADATYALNPVAATDAGVYTVEVTNAAGSVTSAGATLTVVLPPAITTQPAGQSAAIGGSATFTVVATGTDPLSYQWQKSGVDLAGATSATLSLSHVQASDGASYHVVVSNGAGSVTSAEATLTVLAPPTIVTQPASQAVDVGGYAAFGVSATSTLPVTYQWLKDGTPIPGATSATYALGAVTAADTGTYTVEVTNAVGTVTSAGAVLTTNTAYLINVSARAGVKAGRTLILGFVVANGSKPVLVRAGGPVLDQYGLSGLSDPSLKLFDGSATVVATNDNWPDGLRELFATLGATPYEAGSKDAALVATLAGPHTVHVTGTSDGVVLAEAYDADPGNTPNGSKLVNVSARSQVGTGEDVLIGGFVIGGTGRKQVLIRGVGPGLVHKGVTDVLADPQITVFDRATPIAQNDDWSPDLAATFERLGAFALDAGSKDAALVIELDAGKPYTVHVSGAGQTTGEALVEVYDANP